MCTLCLHIHSHFMDPRFYFEKVLAYRRGKLKLYKKGKAMKYNTNLKKINDV